MVSVAKLHSVDPCLIIAHGIRACFWFLTPCAAICTILAFFFIKRVSLKRDDDAQQKAAAKAWIEEKKAKRQGRKDSAGDHSQNGDDAARLATEPSASERSETSTDAGIVQRVEDRLEDAGRGVAEAGGLNPTKDEGVTQGGVGHTTIR